MKEKKDHYSGVNPFYLVILVSIVLFQCSAPGNPSGEDMAQELHLGKAHLEVKGAPAAIPHFDRGLLLLHSFEYADAREAFQKASEVDSSFAMAYWGEAMTHHHPLWRQQALAAGRAALDRLAPTAEARQKKAGSELERDLLKAVEILYGEGDKYDRDKAYSDYLATLYEKYPGNQEVAAFYALSLLGSVPVGRDEEVYERSAVVAGGILRENPNHPGALHYLIHSYDDPKHAHLAKEAADSYADVAPDAAHALHMPSHIYVALGMWDEVVASNIDSYEASVRRMVRKQLDNNARSYHAFHWLLYGYLQQERFDAATAIMEDMARYTDELPSRSARSYLINMRGNYLVETGDWTGKVADIDIPDREDLNISTRAAYYLTEGLKAYHCGKADTLRAVIDRLDREREQDSYLVGDDGVPMCSSAGANRSAPNRQDLALTRVALLELWALEAMIRRADDEAEARLKEAVREQEESSYDYGPPSIVKPSYELYGEWLLAQNRPEEALVQFEQAMFRGPKRVHALRGKLKAAEMAGAEAKAEEARKVLNEIERRTRQQIGESAGTLSLR
jgi:hypothetical protein